MATRERIAQLHRYTTYTVNPCPSAPSLGLVARKLSHLTASATFVYLASMAFTTAVPLWLDNQGSGHQIGWALAVYALAAAGGGLLAAALPPAALLPLLDPADGHGPRQAGRSLLTFASGLPMRIARPSAVWCASAALLKSPEAAWIRPSTVSALRWLAE